MNPRIAPTSRSICAHVFIVRGNGAFTLLLPLLTRNASPESTAVSNRKQITHASGSQWWHRVDCAWKLLQMQGDGTFASCNDGQGHLSVFLATDNHIPTRSLNNSSAFGIQRNGTCRNN